MLVLMRKVGTSVEIQGGIKITILELCNGGVRMGIDALPSVKILRTELIDNPQIELGAPPAIKPEHLADIKDVIDDEDFPAMGCGKLDLKPSHRSVRAGDEAND